MNITDTRRANLTRWAEKNGVPKKEKSLFSQLKGDGSFGEKVARRLESEYKMGAGFLDTPIQAQGDTVSSEATSTGEKPSAWMDGANQPPPKWMDPDSFRLLNLFNALDGVGREMLRDYIEDLLRSRREADGVGQG